MEKIQTVNYKHTITQYYHKAIISWAAPLYFMTCVLDGAECRWLSYRLEAVKLSRDWALYYISGPITFINAERERICKQSIAASFSQVYGSQFIKLYSLDSPDSSDSSDSRTYLSPVHPFFIHLCSSYLNKACTSQSYLIESRIIKSHLYGDVLL